MGQKIPGKQADGLIMSKPREDLFVMQMEKRKIAT
jgi:hypothetical protein